MKKLILSFSFLALFIFGFQFAAQAQSEPVLYFCEEYDLDDGEVNVGDRFYSGYLTVIVKCSYALDLRKVHIQFDKYDPISKKFEYYKKFDYTVKPDMSYIYFEKNEDSDLEFEDPGIYRVFLLDNKDKTVASALIEIID